MRTILTIAYTSGVLPLLNYHMRSRRRTEQQKRGCAALMGNIVGSWDVPWRSATTPARSSDGMERPSISKIESALKAPCGEARLIWPRRSDSASREALAGG